MIFSRRLETELHENLLKCGDKSSILKLTEFYFFLLHEYLITIAIIGFST